MTQIIAFNEGESSKFDETKVADAINHRFG
jgi:hypothetical protein